MPRELETFLGREAKGFDSIDSAYAYCVANENIVYAEIMKRKQYHIIVSSFGHHRRFYHVVATFSRTPRLTLVAEENQ